MSEEALNNYKLVAYLELRTFQKKISWRPYDGGHSGGYTTDILSPSYGFIKIVIQKLGPGYGLEVYTNNIKILGGIYYTIDASMYASLTKLYDFLDKKINNIDGVIDELITYLDHMS